MSKNLQTPTGGMKVDTLQHGVLYPQSTFSISCINTLYPQSTFSISCINTDTFPQLNRILGVPTTPLEKLRHTQAIRKDTLKKLKRYKKGRWL